MNEIHIGRTILTKRKEKNLTQDELAEHFGVTKASVSKWEKEQSYPDITLLPKLAAYFDISIDELMDYDPQLTKEEIRKYYLQFAADFYEQPFDQVMAEVTELMKKYHSCYPLQLQMAVLLINHYNLAEDQDRQVQILEEAVTLCERIKTDSGDMHLIREANSMEAVICLMQGQPDRVVNLLGDPTLHPIDQDEMTLASAYKMTGDHQSAKRTLQITGYQYVLYLIGSGVMLLDLYKDDTEHFEAVLQRTQTVIDTFQIMSLHPNAYLQFALSAASSLTWRKEYDRAVSYLEMTVQAYESAPFPIMLHGDEYFDLLDDWFAEFDLGVNAPRDKRLLKESFQQILHSPAFQPLSGRKDYENILTRAEKL